MPPLISSRAARLTLSDALPRDATRLARLALVVVPHLVALTLMLWSEEGPLRMAAFLCAWGIVNFFWLVLLRRPALSAALSLLLLVALIIISRFKFQILWMTASFIDVMIIDSDTFTFLWMVFPKLRIAALIALAIGAPAAVMIWRLDPFRIRRRAALSGLAVCVSGLCALAFAVPPPREAFGDMNYVSGFRALRSWRSLGVRDAWLFGIRPHRRWPPGLRYRGCVQAGGQAPSHPAGAR